MREVIGISVGVGIVVLLLLICCILLVCALLSQGMYTPLAFIGHLICLANGVCIILSLPRYAYLNSQTNTTVCFALHDDSVSEQRTHTLQYVTAGS